MNKIFTSFLGSSIQTKLMLMFMSLTFVALFIACIGFISYNIHTVKHNTVQELQRTGDVIGKRIAPLISFLEDTQKAEKIISDLSSKESVVLSCIYMKNNKVLVRYRPKGSSHICPEIAPQFGHEFSSEFVSIHREIYSIDSTAVGSIYILSDLREFDKQLKELVTGMAVLITLVMMITFYIARFLERIITKPINELIQVARSVKQNDDYSLRAKHYYDDEMGFLIKHFNAMMETIQEWRQKLESMVQKRTLQLEKANDKLQKTNTELEEEKIKADAANYAKSEFLRNMSHEFRTPLHGMGNFAHYGVEGYETADREELFHWFKRIKQSNQRLLRLVDDILLVASMEDGEERFSFERHDIRESAITSLKETEALVEAKKLKVTIDTPPFSTEAIFDGDKMVQIFTNIIGNAIKFAPENTEIAIKFSETTIQKNNKVSPALSVSISDEGVGVPEEEIEKIFEKFEQSTRTKTGAGGTGLGLTIVSEIIQIHEGNIAVSNNDIAGATFTITIPLHLEKGERIVKLFSDYDQGGTDGQK